MVAFLSKLMRIALLAFFLAPAGGALAQDEGNPTIAILRFGYSIRSGISTTEAAVIDVLQAYGFISEEERPALISRSDMAGENITILFGDAGYDFADAALMVELALDQGADALFTISTPVTQIALNAVSDLDDPPAIIFLQVVNPREAGIIESACIKPANVTGLEASAAYENVLPLLLMQDPDLQVIGTIFNTNTDAVVVGAMVGSGYNLFFEQGARAGRILVGYLKGDIDIARTGVDSSSSMGVRVNLDVAKELKVEIADELLEMSQATLEDGRLQIDQGRMIQLIQALGVGPQDMQALVQPLRDSVTGARQGQSGGVSAITVAALQLESSQASYKAFLESLHCTDEMIAEQLAALRE